MIGFLASLFGCSKTPDNTPDYPFDTEKAYCYSRQGVIAGGDFHLTLDPEGIVDYYSYVKPVPENECGMKDRGADIYFVGLKEGRGEVTAIFGYPTCEDEIYTFTLNVNKDLFVTRIE